MKKKEIIFTDFCLIKWSYIKQANMGLFLVKQIFKYKISVWQEKAEIRSNSYWERKNICYIYKYIKYINKMEWFLKERNICQYTIINIHMGVQIPSQYT